MGEFEDAGGDLNMEYQVKALNLPSDAFQRGYLECAEWVGILYEESRATFRDSVSPRWNSESLAQAREDCESFQAAAGALLDGADASRAGHDFFLTRNRHGAGFWDGDYPEPAGRKLTDMAHVYGEANVDFDAEIGILFFLE